MSEQIADHEKRIGKLETWKNGNGLMGAAEMIKCHEGRIDEAEKHQIMEPFILQETFAKAMKERSKSKEGMIRAFGPYFAALCTLAAATVVLLK